MNQEKAAIFLENLIERIEKEKNSNKWKIDGVISDKERKALVYAFQLVTGGKPPEPASTAVVIAESEIIPSAVKTVALNLNSLSIDSPENPGVLLCLDFGTAMSKAFATEDSDEILLDLEIGRRAGQENPIYSLQSSVFITDDGRILFGHRAISESTHTVTGPRKRFDSIKDILCKDVIHNLDNSPLDKEFNPTDVALSKGDMVTLFLAYFTDMAVSELAGERFKKSRYVRRRFTRPVLPPDRAPWAEEQLRTLLARAQILADTLNGKWQDGIGVQEAKYILDEIRNLEEIPTFLVDDGVVEPVAAVGSRVRNYICSSDKKRLLMVVDVGAGTIDFALFAEVEKKGEPPHIWEVPGSVQYLRQAGDTVDKLLRRYILQKADISTTDSDYHLINAELSLNIRNLKEELFREGVVGYSLTNDATGEVHLDGFLEQRGVKELENAIHEKFRQVLNNVHPSWIDGLGHGLVPVVFTGGGAQLPMVRSLDGKQEIIHNKSLEIKSAVPIPRWVNEEYEELINEYLHLAVAIGGASRNLPTLAPQTFEEFGGLEAHGWTIKPAYKGS